MNNTIVQLEDPLNISIPGKVKNTKGNKGSKTKKQKNTTNLSNSNSLVNSGYQSDVDTPDEKKSSKSKKKVLRKKRTPKLKVSKPSKLSSVGKSSKLSKRKRINFNKFLKDASKTKKSIKRRLHNIENSLNLTSGYDSDKEEESIMESMPKIPNMSLNNINSNQNTLSIPNNRLSNNHSSKAISKSFMYHSKLQNGKLTEEGEYVLNNSTKPHYIKGLIKNGQITEKKVRK